jgi:DNA-binding transcriptional MerR regulator
MFKTIENKNLKPLGSFSIKDIEAVTGIKGHTLRIWEQRYGIVIPKRTETNIRYYDDNDLKKLLNISLLNNHGFKISEIAKMRAEEIYEEVLRLSTSKYAHEAQIKAFISAMLEFNEIAFNQQLSACFIQFGIEYTLLNIIFPLLIEIGILWQIGSIQPSHEHFVTNIIKQKLYVAIDGQVGRFNKSSKRFLLFLPENEKHSIGLLFANYLIRSRGHEVLYLGQEVPLNDLKDAFKNDNPDFILTLMSCAQPHIDKNEFVQFLKDNWPNSMLLLTGSQFLMANIDPAEKVKMIQNFEVFIEYINKI